MGGTNSAAICGGRMRREIRGRITKWCFHCRKRLKHRKVVLIDEYDPETQLGGWYESVIKYECSRCGGDYTDFPGYEYTNEMEE